MQGGFTKILALLVVVMLAVLGVSWYFLNVNSNPNPLALRASPTTALVPSTPPPSPSQPPSNVALPDKPVINLASGKPSQDFPTSKTITNTATVKQLYDDIYALPPFPSGEIHCPADFGTSYNVDFYFKNSLILQATYDPNGCQDLAVRGQTPRMALGNKFPADFQAVLASSN